MSATDSTERRAIPCHVAFVMDGNGRWATRQGLPRLVGHRAGIERVGPVAEAVFGRGVCYMTLFMFSTENWSRSREEVDGIFDLISSWLETTTPFLKQRGMSLKHVGRREPLPQRLLDALDAACAPPARTDGPVLAMAINYGGRAEIVDAIRSLAEAGVASSRIDQAALSGALYTAGMPDPDLLVRPGGEMRLSNYLLWQAAYAELYFSTVLWPDFGEDEIDRALDAFAQRQRRFGGL